MNLTLSWQTRATVRDNWSTDKTAAEFALNWRHHGHVTAWEHTFTIPVKISYQNELISRVGPAFPIASEQQHHKTLFKNVNALPI